MQITVQTSRGVYVIPSEREVSLINWLEQNAVRLGQESVKEHRQPLWGENLDQSKYLINENFKGEF